MLRPTIAKLLNEPLGETAVKITRSPVVVGDVPMSRLSFNVQVRGANISPEQEELVAKYLSGGDS